MYYMKPDGEFVYSPDVGGLGGIMAPHNPMLGAAYAMSSLLPSDVGTPTIDMNVRMPDERAMLSGCQFCDSSLNGFGAVQDAVSVLSFVDLMTRA